MTSKVHSVRLGSALEARVQAYSSENGVSASEAVRLLVEKGLISESLDIYALPLGEYISRCIRSEMALLQSLQEQHDKALEERLAKVTSKGTKAALANAVQVADLSRVLVEAYRGDSAGSIYDYYMRIGGLLQRGDTLESARASASGE